MGNSKTILIIDNKPLLIDISEMLQLEGFKTVEAENGQQGLECLRQHSFDLILSDILLPIMDGYTFLKEVRSGKACAHIPFLFISALSLKDQIAHGLSLGADAYVTKPFTALELVCAVYHQLAL